MSHKHEQSTTITTEATQRHLSFTAAALTVGAFTVVFALMRGRFRVNITALTAIHITGSMGAIAIDPSRVEAALIATNLARSLSETA